MNTALDKKFPNDQRITIRNHKDKSHVITRPWLSAKHLVDKGWTIVGSEATAVKKSSESAGAGTAPKADVVKNNFDLFTDEELKTKYKEIYNKKPFHKWDKEKLLEKIKDGTKKD